MTDTTQLIPNNLAVTSDLDYRLKPSAVRSRSYRASILPTNKNTFNPTDTAIVYVPGGRRNTYLDCSQSYIRMTLKNTDATGVFSLDNNANCMINRLDVFHGSNLLETIQTYNILSSYIFDMQISVSEKMSLSNIYGFNLDNTRQGVELGPGDFRTFCMPIFSGVVGCLSDKMLPLGILADDIRLEFTFESLASGVVTTTAFTSTTPPGTCQILDFQLQLTIVELSDEGENMVRSNYQYPQMPLYLHGCSWRHYVSQLPAAGGGYSTLVPARFASLKQLACLPRRSIETNSASSYSLSSRANPNFAQYSWRIGSALIPSKPVYLEGSGNTGGYGEAYAELLKSWHALHTISTASCLTNEFMVGDAVITDCPQRAITSNVGSNSYKNGFVIAQELESFAQRSDVLLSGMNTLSSQVFFETQITTPPTNTYTLDFFAWYDHIMVIDQGIISIKY
jgi:hypothetical protein